MKDLYYHQQFLFKLSWDLPGNDRNISPEFKHNLLEICYDYQMAVFFVKIEFSEVYISTVTTNVYIIFC